MNYLKQKYNKSSDLVSNELGKALKLPKPGNIINVMKTNILEMLQIHSNKKQYKMKEKIDSFYISQVIPRILTRNEHQRHIRKQDQRSRVSDPKLIS